MTEFSRGGAETRRGMKQQGVEREQALLGKPAVAPVAEHGWPVMENDSLLAGASG